MSPTNSWHEVVARLEERIQPTTDSQRRLGAIIECPVGDEPALVSAAKLMIALQDPLLADLKLTTEAQWEYLSDLALFVGEDLPEEPEFYLETSAWITYFTTRRTIKAHTSLQLEVGDIVCRYKKRSDIFHVSSLGTDGRVNFRGGNGARDFPHRLDLLFRRDDIGEDVERARTEVENRIELFRPASWEFDSRHTRHLEKYRVTELAGDDAIDELAFCVNDALDERPIQALLTKQPALLRPIAPATRDLWVIPEVDLGGKYRADFLVAHRDSVGMQWIYVELESPTANPINKKGMKGKEFNKGESQIKDWRDWVMQNLHTACLPPDQGGSGLYHIRPGSPGLLLIGREFDRHYKYSQVKTQLEEDSAIVTHSYDWLISVNREKSFLGRGGPVDWYGIEHNISDAWTPRNR